MQQNHSSFLPDTDALMLPRIVEDKFMFDDYPGEEQYTGAQKLGILAVAIIGGWGVLLALGAAVARIFS